MGISAALFSGSKCYFFDGARYIRVTRGNEGPGTVDAGYPKPITQWGWPAGFGQQGIDAALYAGPKCYFFDGNRYIRVSRGETGAGTVDAGYPKPITTWAWPGGFGQSGIDAALYSGTKAYFFDGPLYLRVTRGGSEPWTVDDGYPRTIADVWGWPGRFGRFGIDAALFSGTKCYFFDGNRYIRVTRGDVGPGTVDPGYSKRIHDVWNWPEGFGVGERVVVFFKTLLPLSAGVQSLIDTQYREMRRLFLKFGIEVVFGAVEDLSGDPDLEDLVALDVGPCLLGQPTAEHQVLFAQRTGAGPDDLVVYVVQTLEGDNDSLLGCATHPAGRPGAAIVPTPALWLTAHEIGHVLGLRHVCEFPSDTNPSPPTPCVVGSTQSDNVMFPRMTWTRPPPNISAAEAARMLASSLSKPT